MPSFSSSSSCCSIWKPSSLLLLLLVLWAERSVAPQVSLQNVAVPIHVSRTLSLHSTNSKQPIRSGSTKFLAHASSQIHFERSSSGAAASFSGANLQMTGREARLQHVVPRAGPNDEGWLGDWQRNEEMTEETQKIVKEKVKAKYGYNTKGVQKDWMKEVLGDEAKNVEEAMNLLKLLKRANARENYENAASYAQVVGVQRFVLAEATKLVIYEDLFRQIFEKLIRTSLPEGEKVPDYFKLEGKEKVGMMLAHAKLEDLKKYFWHEMLRFKEGEKPSAVQIQLRLGRMKFTLQMDYLLDVLLAKEGVNLLREEDLEKAKEAKDKRDKAINAVDRFGHLLLHDFDNFKDWDSLNKPPHSTGPVPEAIMEEGSKSPAAAENGKQIPNIAEKGTQNPWIAKSTWGGVPGQWRGKKAKRPDKLDPSIDSQEKLEKEEKLEEEDKPEPSSGNANE